MIRYYITDRQALGGIPALLECIARNALAGVEWIQIREKDLPAHKLFELTRAALRISGASRIIVNTRLDIALAAGAHGVHLPSNSIAPSRLRPLCPAGFLIGVSTHTIADVRGAESEGADYAVFGPVFPSGKKRPVGVTALTNAVEAVRIPVIALGGITHPDRKLPGAGVAGIRLFQRDVLRDIPELPQHFPPASKP